MFNIGNRIRELRKFNNITTTELSNKIGISQAQLSRIENNVNTAQFDTIMKICEVFSITLSEFFNDDNSDPIVLTSELKELLNSAKDLTPEQLELLSKFIQSLK
ncbi:helix-turn-helix domain-containing protein [Clostridium sp. BJN0013]|uniref:helix-turn-helix domain-containing protein n=1 Tax=Clostridium sp. BJN0013 TaxID=3236840 RepID=UPI0034C62F9E